MTTITIKAYGETITLIADFADASCQMLLDGEPIGQVADARHSPERAVEMAMHAAFGAAGDEYSMDDVEWSQS